MDPVILACLAFVWKMAPEAILQLPPCPSVPYCFVYKGKIKFSAPTLPANLLTSSRPLSLRSRPPALREKAGRKKRERPRSRGSGRVRHHAEPAHLQEAGPELRRARERRGGRGADSQNRVLGRTLRRRDERQARDTGQKKTTSQYFFLFQTLETASTSTVS